MGDLIKSADRKLLSRKCDAMLSRTGASDSVMSLYLQLPYIGHLHAAGVQVIIHRDEQTGAPSYVVLQSSELVSLSQEGNREGVLERPAISHRQCAARTARRSAAGLQASGMSGTAVVYGAGAHPH